MCKLMSLFDDSELKRRLKADKKAKEKAEKSAAATAALPTTVTTEPSLSVKESEDIDPSVSCHNKNLLVCITMS